MSNIHQVAVLGGEEDPLFTLAFAIAGVLDVVNHPLDSLADEA